MNAAQPAETFRATVVTGLLEPVTGVIAGLHAGPWASEEQPPQVVGRPECCALCRDQFGGRGGNPVERGHVLGQPIEFERSLVAALRDVLRFGPPGTLAMRSRSTCGANFRSL